MSIVLGIDLGTSFSCAAAVRGHSVVVAEDARGRRTMPSIVNFASSGRVVVGHEARRLVVKDPDNTILSAKRFLGRRYDDGAVRIARNAYFYKVSEGPNSWPMIEARGGPYTVAEVCACVLHDLRSKAEAFFGEPVRQAVITVQSSRRCSSALALSASPAFRSSQTVTRSPRRCPSTRALHPLRRSVATRSSC